MNSLVVKFLVNAVAIWVTSIFVSGIYLAEDASNMQRVKTILLVAAVFGVINMLIKPIVSLFSFPLFILTLGLITFVINALMLWLTSYVSGKLDLAFHVDGFWPALLGSLVISLVSWALSMVLDRD